jgi:pimeloyl-ACP methyl ester carboxylesterase
MNMNTAGSAVQRRIVLVHGAAHGAWCWESVVPLLEAGDFEVQAPDLPGLGDDPLPAADVRFDDYVARIVDVLRSRPDPAMLVGHSLAGGPVSRAAEECPGKVSKLIYLAAYVPVDGESLGDIGFAEMPDSAGRAIRPSTEKGAHEFDPEVVARYFYNRCDNETARRAIARLRPQATAPLAEPIRISAESWGALSKLYVVCTDDRALPPRMQEWLCDRAGLRKRYFDSDHSPFLSDPAGFADLLREEAARE